MVELTLSFSAEGLSNKESESDNLISDKTATNNLHVTFDTVAFDQDTGIITFSNLAAVKRDKSVLASRKTLLIRVFSNMGN